MNCKSANVFFYRFECNLYRLVYVGKRKVYYTNGYVVIDPYHRPNLIVCESHGRCLIKIRNSLSFANILVHPRAFGRVRVSHCFDLIIFYCQIYTTGLNTSFTTYIKFSHFSFVLSICMLFTFVMWLMHNGVWGS
jgi:hypothetical protein